MDKIEVKNNKSIYEVYDNEFLDIYINDQPLHFYLDNKLPGNKILGLVPPFDGWLIDKEDENILWDRLIPEEGKTTILPILICPDDRDYVCTVVVTKVIFGQETVYWQHFGMDNSETQNNPAAVGTKVNWLNHNDRLTFSKEEYLREVRRFRGA